MSTENKNDKAFSLVNCVLFIEIIAFIIVSYYSYKQNAESAVRIEKHKYISNCITASMELQDDIQFFLDSIKNPDLNMKEKFLTISVEEIYSSLKKYQSLLILVNIDLSADPNIKLYETKQKLYLKTISSDGNFDDLGKSLEALKKRLYYIQSDLKTNLPMKDIFRVSLSDVSKGY